MKKLSVLAIILLLVFTLTFCVFADEYVYYPEESSDSEDISIAWFVGPIAGAIAVICVCVSYKRGIHGDTYPLSQYSKLHLKASSDNFTHKTVVITRIPDPPSSKK